MSVPPEIRVVREMLEGVLSHSVASRVMFEALGNSTLPSSIDETLTFIRGPLWLRLVAQLGEEPAKELVGSLDRVLHRRKRTGSFYDLDVVVEEAESPEHALTNPMSVAVDDPVQLMVVSANLQLSSLLDFSLGDDYVQILQAFDAEDVRRLTFAKLPLIALVDGDQPIGDADVVAAALNDMPASVVRAIWASDATGGRALARAIEERGGYAVQVARADGLDPLLDLVRSRRRTTGPPPT